LKIEKEEAEEKRMKTDDCGLQMDD